MTICITNKDRANITEDANSLELYDRVFDVFYRKHELGVFAYDLPCQHVNTRSIEVQSRAADELAATKFICLDCGTFIE